MTTEAFQKSFLIDKWSTVTSLFIGLAAVSSCSTTEQEVAERIEILAANEIDSPAWNQSVDELAQIGRPAARQLMTLLDPALYLNKQYREYRSEVEKTRTGAAVALGRIRHKAATASLVARVTTAYTMRERVAALQAVSELGFDLAAVKELEKQLIDVDPLIRLYAAMALLKMGEVATQERIRSVVLGDDEALAKAGITDFDRYSVVPGAELAPDFFI